MDKIGDFFDEITPIFEAKNFDHEHAAVILLGADFDHECATYQGTVKSMVAMVVAAMENKNELSYIILKASEVFLERRKAEKEMEEESCGVC